jgi:hypothetical protein
MAAGRGDKPKEATSTPPDAKLQPALDYIQQALHGLRFGEIKLIVQDGVVVQIERTERRRVGRDS